jgi:hypothetical protein
VAVYFESSHILLASKVMIYASRGLGLFPAIAGLFHGRKKRLTRLAGRYVTTNQERADLNPSGDLKIKSVWQGCGVGRKRLFVHELQTTN